MKKQTVSLEVALTIYMRKIMAIGSRQRTYYATVKKKENHLQIAGESSFDNNESKPHNINFWPVHIRMNETKADIMHDCLQDFTLCHIHGKNVICRIEDSSYLMKIPEKTFKEICAAA